MDNLKNGGASNSVSKPKNATPKRSVRMSLSERAGLQLPVSNIHRILREGYYAQRISVVATVHLTAVLEYLTAKVLRLAAEAAIAGNRPRISPHHIALAIGNNEELRILLAGVTITRAGVVPRHQAPSVPKKTRKSQSNPVALVALAVSEAAARAQDEGEARSPVRGGLLKRGGLVKGKTTTTTTTPAPQEEEEYEDEDYAAEEQQEPSTEAPPSSTEGKKLVAGGVRPFRSNTDLLETLKRRRAQAAEQSKHGHSSGAQAHESAASESAAKTSYSKKRVSSAPPAREANSEESAPAPAPVKPSRGRFGKPAIRAIQESDAEEQFDAPAPARSGRGFSRRGAY